MFGMLIGNLIFCDVVLQVDGVLKTYKYRKDY